MKTLKTSLAIVVLTTVVGGVAEYINIYTHPENQPLITVFIITIAAVANGIAVWYYWRKYDY